MQPAPISNISDLFTSIAAGHEPSFTKLYHQYYSRIFSTALQYCKIRSLAEDIVQQVFFIVWEKRATLATIENGESWLWTVTRNQTMNLLRKEASKQTYITHIKERFTYEEASPLQELLNKQKGERIEQIINSLTARQQQVYKLSRNEGLTYAEIAKTLELSPDTVKEYMSNALKTMRKMLLQYKDEILILVTWILLEKFFSFVPPFFY
jgi:RNA polymerase sigma-70 factor (family 1)